SIAIDGSVPLTVAGAGRDVTVLQEAVPEKALLNIRSDGVVVQDLTLDTQTYNGRAAISVVANHTTLQRSRVLGGDKAFALYYVGPPGATRDKPVYNQGNSVLDTQINDRISDDGFSFSFQSGGAVRNID